MAIKCPKWLREWVSGKCPDDFDGTGAGGCPASAVIAKNSEIIATLQTAINRIERKQNRRLESGEEILEAHENGRGEPALLEPGQATGYTML